jgi:TPR repeat protein
MERWTAAVPAPETTDTAPKPRAKLARLRDDQCEDRPQLCVRHGVALTRTDLRRAASLFESACAGGALDGCANFGVMLVQGRGIDRDVERGRALLRRTCDDGHELGCRNLRAMPDAG